MRFEKSLSAVALGLAISQVSVAENSVVETLKEGDFIADLRLRYESNDADDAASRDAASALTLRTRLGYETVEMAGFKVLYEIEDSRALIDDYSPEDTDYDTVADPENTEINRAQIAYHKDAFRAVIGRQRIILDNARFIGNVGWRQNEQTFDALTLSYTQDDISVLYSYVDQVNGILRNFDADTTDHLFNVSYAGLAAGKLVGYAYLTEDDDTDSTLDTYGASFAGQTDSGDITVTYRAELATQSSDDYDASYFHLEAGAIVSAVTFALGNETLGSDNGNYGFQTPLATKHAFNGWADMFLATPAVGLSDTYIKAGGKLAGIKLLAVYHDFSADEGSTDLGSEIDLLAAKKIDDNFTVGVKYAAYSEGDMASKPDTDKLWIWGEARF
ncbi:MAG: alginate export family protein [Pseudomonadota bacterium]|nr:alginate export family protein [Pseudomonadota bacterium]